MSDPISLEDQVKAAVAGDRQALESVIESIQDWIYALAVRMLWHPGEARDATQEILIRVVTQLSSYRHQSQFRTWVYRVAANTLINYNQRLQRQQQSFSAYAEQLREGLSDEIRATANAGEQRLLVAEAKLGCSNAMLQCLGEEERIAYVLGEILEFSGTEAGLILDLAPATFRKRLSRARQKLHRFIEGNCGLVNKDAACRCHKKVDHAIRRGHIQPSQLLFARKGQAEQLIARIDQIEEAVGLYRCDPAFEVDRDWAEKLRRVVVGA